MKLDARPHFIYRCYDAAERLIYVGCTNDVKKRMQTHKASSNKTSRWLMTCIARFEVAGPYDGLAEGHRIEAESIQVEQPVFNYQRRAGVGLAAWMTRAGVGRYLIEHGHRALAEETCCTCWPEYREVGEKDPSCVPHAHLALSDAESRAFKESVSA